MDATFLAAVKNRFPTVRFVSGRKFLFRPPKTIMIGPEEDGDELLLLHELGHFLSGHRNFGMNIERMMMEVEAWEKTRGLAAEFGIEINEEIIEGELDSYREWIAQKSRCPKCGLARYETPDGQYHCPRCENF